MTVRRDRRDRMTGNLRLPEGFMETVDELAEVEYRSRAEMLRLLRPDLRPLTLWLVVRRPDDIVE